MFIYHEDIQLQRMLFNSACFHCAQNIVFPIYYPGNTAYYGPFLSIILLSFSGISALCIFTFLCCDMIMPSILRLKYKVTPVIVVVLVILSHKMTLCYLRKFEILPGG